jgi:hypothetical protein
MKCWSSGSSFVGSAGILPVRAGILPAIFCQGGKPLEFVNFAMITQTVRQNAGRCGQHARAPHHVVTL